jgi:hypothetical protein
MRSVQIEQGYDPLVVFRLTAEKQKRFQEIIDKGGMVQGPAPRRNGCLVHGPSSSSMEAILDICPCR